MIAGRAHVGNDPHLLESMRYCEAVKARLDAIPNSDIQGRNEILRDLLAEGSGPCVIRSPFNIQYGRHLHMGARVFMNFGATFLDSAPIQIGTMTAIGPNVQFLADGHPICPEDRFRMKSADELPPFDVINIASPITVGEYVWIGGGAIILGGALQSATARWWRQARWLRAMFPRAWSWLVIRRA